MTKEKIQDTHYRAFVRDKVDDISEEVRTEIDLVFYSLTVFENSIGVFKDNYIRDAVVLWEDDEFTDVYSELLHSSMQ